MTPPTGTAASSVGRRITRPAPRRLAPALLVGVTLVATACAPDGPSNDGPAAVEAVSDAVAAGLAVPPLDLDDVAANIADHYRAAETYRDVYAQVPCYCGCERSIGHRHLADCFVRSDGEGWDAHAAACTVCTDESAMVRQLIADGADATTIRQSIIAEFGHLAPAPSI